jgi:hypothetical protein
MVGYLLMAISFLVGTAYAVGRAEVRMDTRINAVELADLNNHKTAMSTIAQAVNERILMLKPVYDHMEREARNDSDLAATLTKIATELTALRVGQENTNRRIDEMRQERRS